MIGSATLSRARMSGFLGVVNIHQAGIKIDGQVVLRAKSGAVFAEGDR